MIRIDHAGPEDLHALAGVIAEAFLDLPPARWLIADPAERRRVFPGYFLIFAEYILAAGVVYVTGDRSAAALWMPAGAEPQEPPDGYYARLRAATGARVERFAAFDEALDRHHPAGVAHHHLAFLAARPDRQGRGLGTALLAAHHQTLDQAGLPAYLEASSDRNRRLYLRHGYALMPGAPYHLPDGGPPMWPMWREPQPGPAPAGTAG
jgi:GNAT superfamily N-acetyltransferase